MNNSIYSEYVKNLNKFVLLKKELSSLPVGYISTKTIRGKKQTYLQKRIGSKVKSKFINPLELDSLMQQLERRNQISKELPILTQRISQLEEAAKLVNYSLYCSCLTYKLSCNMDTLNKQRKEQCISFATAMNAIEGVPISEETRLELSAWQNGEKNFLTIFNSTLKRYGFPVEV